MSDPQDYLLIPCALQRNKSEACKDRTQEIERLRKQYAELKDKLQKAEKDCEVWGTRCIRDAKRTDKLQQQTEEFMLDAMRYRYLRNRIPSSVLDQRGDIAGCWIDCEVEDRLVLLTGKDADDALDQAIAKAQGE